MRMRESQSGQILLITLLVLVVATTVALSLIGRTTTDVNVSTQLDESARAFSAAEAGIEQALKTQEGTSGVQTLTPGVTYQVNKADIGGGAGTYLFPRVTAKGETDTLWLATHDDATGAFTSPYYPSTETINLCWQNTAAVAVSVLYYVPTDGTYKIGKMALESSAARAQLNDFTDLSGSRFQNCGEDPRVTTINKIITFSDFGITAADQLLALRIRPLYGDTQLVVQPTASLPKQGNTFEGTGATGTGATRKVVVYQLYRAPSSLFDYAIYVQSGSLQSGSGGGN